MPFLLENLQLHLKKPFKVELITNAVISDSLSFTTWPWPFLEGSYAGANDGVGLGHRLSQQRGRRPVVGGQGSCEWPRCTGGWSLALGLRQR